MKTLTTCLLGLASVALVASANASSTPKTATGFVFHDANNNRAKDAGEKALPGVHVSNGSDIVATDDDGRYELPITDDTILFVIKPSGWRTPVDEMMLPRFYYIHKPNGSPPNYQFKGVAPTGPLPESVDFPLYPNKEPEKFQALMFGDPQPRDQKEIDYIAHDVIEELVGAKAAFGVTLGDIMFDNLSLFESGAKTIALLGIPWYNVIGNHDVNREAKEDRLSDESFEAVFGPPYYSFDYGPVHFLVLDDIDWRIHGSNQKPNYRGGLDDRQMEFIRNDLLLVPREKLVVLMMHIPLVNVENRRALYRLIEQRKFCISISGHTHTHEHHFITKDDGWMGPKPHHHIVNVTVSGSWWSGAPDERGIPHTMMADGAPNGYSILSFDGSDYTLDFKAAARPKSYQMRIHAPEAVAAGKTEQTLVYVNVFNGSERSKVDLAVGNAGWRRMKRVIEVDPHFRQLVESENIEGKTWRDLPKPNKLSTHLWRLPLPPNLAPGVHRVRIRTTDMHGRTYDASRVIRVVRE